MIQIVYAIIIVNEESSLPLNPESTKYKVEENAS